MEVELMTWRGNHGGTDSTEGSSITLDLESLESIRAKMARYITESVCQVANIF